jgi:hypothetical protein
LDLNCGAVLQLGHQAVNPRSKMIAAVAALDLDDSQQIALVASSRHEVAERYLGKKPPDTGLDAYSRTVALVVSGFDLALPASAVLDVSWRRKPSYSGKSKMTLERAEAAARGLWLASAVVAIKTNSGDRELMCCAINSTFCAQAPQDMIVSRIQIPLRLPPRPPRKRTDDSTRGPVAPRAVRRPGR